MKSIAHARRLWRRAMLPAAVLVLVIPLVNLGAYPMRVAVMCAIYSLLALSLNLLTGIAGQVSLGHAAFYAVGAYTSALMALRLGAPLWISMPAAMLMGAAMGFVTYLPSRRVSGGYLAIVTMGIGEIVRLTLVNWQSLTRGPMGLPGVPQAKVFGQVLASPYQYYLFAMPMALIALMLLVSLSRSNAGRKLNAVRIDPIAAESMGIYPNRMKALAFTLSGAIAALAGALYAHFIGFIDPGSFRSDESITVLCMVVLGGMGNLPGSVLAAFLLTILPEFLRGLDNVRMLIYGALLVAMMLIKTTGRKHEARS
ncbi:MAG: branched-chain amino acid ABC transporter permease [Candidatus Fimadaptatus sp.]|jgi:branched-chain amino acid transport system permease protein